MSNRTLVVAQLGHTPIQIHWSWPLALLVLAASITPLYEEIRTEWQIWSAAISTALVIYLSILLHELAHAVTSRARGLPVHAVTLFGFGGRTEVDEAHLSPVTELMVALSGPVVSLALTCLWGLAALALPSGPLQTFTAAQAIVNGSLLALNLLPGYPLDGGRVLKAALWFLMDEELSAARLARQIGRTFGWGMIIIGALFTLRSGDISVGLLLGAGGYILNRIAHNGYQQLILQLTLRSVSVADVMQRLYPTIPPDLLLDQFVERFVLAHNEHGFPVVERPEVDTPQPLLGLMTVRDLRRFSRRQRTVTRVQEAMTPVGHVPILPPDGSATDALRMLVESGHELLPVVGDDQLLGVVRRRDLAHYIRARLARE